MVDVIITKAMKTKSPLLEKYIVDRAKDCLSKLKNLYFDQTYFLEGAKEYEINPEKWDESELDFENYLNELLNDLAQELNRYTRFMNLSDEFVTLETKNKLQLIDLEFKRLIKTANHRSENNFKKH